ncbi:N-acetyltransferase [Alcaligenaceae bacterium 429]|uniref:GNAT family N-acetyltransferase n=1 Tax=Paenalcaligenes sp. Me52 TaxID=3392038 RepID=UPI001091A6BD|nr:N-acetyltransferase [Alcaligenaceae bacterium 429]
MPQHSPLSFSSILPCSDGSICIRTMQDSDAEAYAAGTEDASVKRFAHLPLDHYTPEIVRDMIQGVIAEGLQAGFLAVLSIADANNDEFLGSMVFFDITATDAEIGYWVAPNHRGRKVSKHALLLAMEISRQLGLTHLRARTVIDNPASAYVLTTVGFAQQGEPTAETVPSGKTEMSVKYQIAL